MTSGFWTSEHVQTHAETALRALQRLDELAGGAFNLGENRRHLIEAETALGEVLGLVCTGVPDGWNEDGSVAYYSHNENTCPIHEWLYPQDGRDVHEQQRAGAV